MFFQKVAASLRLYLANIGSLQPRRTAAAHPPAAGPARHGSARRWRDPVLCIVLLLSGWVGGGGHHMESTPRHLLPTTTTHPPSGCLQAGVLVFVAGCAGSKKHLHGFPPPLPPAWVGGWRVTTPPTTTTRGQRGHTLRSCQNQKFRNLNSRQFSEIRPWFKIQSHYDLSSIERKSNLFLFKTPLPPSNRSKLFPTFGWFPFWAAAAFSRRTAGAPDDPCALLTYNSDFSCIADDETVVLYDVDQHDREDDKVFAKIWQFLQICNHPMIWCTIWFQLFSFIFSSSNMEGALMISSWINFHVFRSPAPTSYELFLMPPCFASAACK